MTRDSFLANLMSLYFFTNQVLQEFAGKRWRVYWARGQEFKARISHYIARHLESEMSRPRDPERVPLGHHILKIKIVMLIY